MTLEIVLVLLIIIIIIFLFKCKNRYNRENRHNIINESFTNDDKIKPFTFYAPFGCYKNISPMFNKKFQFKNNKNIVDRCADVAKNLGSQFFGISGCDTCFVEKIGEPNNFNNFLPSDECFYDIGNDDNIKVYKWNDVIDKDDIDDYTFYEKIGCIDKYYGGSHINFDDYPNYKNLYDPIIKCALIARDAGSITFSVQNGNCWMNKNENIYDNKYQQYQKVKKCHPYGLDSDNTYKIFSWNINNIKPKTPVTINFNIRMHPLIPFIKITTKIATYYPDLRKTRRLLNQYGKKYGIYQDVYQLLLNETFTFDTQNKKYPGKEYFETFFIKGPFGNILREAFNLNIVMNCKQYEKIDFKFNGNDNSKDTFERLSKDLVYTFNLDKGNNLSDSDIVIIILKIIVIMNGEKINLRSKLNEMNNNTFDEFLSKDDEYFKNIFEHYFQVNFRGTNIFMWKEKCFSSDESNTENNIGKIVCTNEFGDQVSEIKCQGKDKPELRKCQNINPKEYKYQEECILNEDKSKYIPNFICVDCQGNTVSDIFCENSQAEKNISNKCNELNTPSQYKWVENCVLGNNSFKNNFKCVDGQDNLVDIKYCRNLSKPKISKCINSSTPHKYRWKEFCILNQQGNRYNSIYKCVNCKGHIVPNNLCSGEILPMSSKCIVKNAPKDVRWVEICNLNKDKTKYLPSIKCITYDGNIVPDNFCTMKHNTHNGIRYSNLKPSITNKCKNMIPPNNYGWVESCKLDKDWSKYRSHISCVDKNNNIVNDQKCKDKMMPKKKMCKNLIAPNQIVRTERDFTNGKEMEVGIEFNNKMCWLAQDKINTSEDYPTDMYPLKLNCKGRGDKFKIEKSDYGHRINKEIDGKKCNVIFTPEGENRGSRIYNVALSCDNDDQFFSDMQLKEYDKYYKIHPTKRNKCYLGAEKFINTNFKTSRIAPIFTCFSTPLSSVQKGKKISFV